MRAYMIDAYERDAQCGGIALGKADTHQQRSKKPRPRGDSDSIEIFLIDPGLPQSSLNDLLYPLRVEP